MSAWPASLGRAVSNVVVSSSCDFCGIRIWRIRKTAADSLEAVSMFNTIRRNISRGMDWSKATPKFSKDTKVSFVKSVLQVSIISTFFHCTRSIAEVAGC
jgi:hypothetical protein